MSGKSYQHRGMRDDLKGRLTERLRVRGKRGRQLYFVQGTAG